VSWWRLAPRGEFEQQLSAELQFHLESAAADYIRAGMSEPEARRRARLQFGGIEQVKEECRDARGVGFLNDLLRRRSDCTAGGRARADLLRNPGLVDSRPPRYPHQSRGGFAMGISQERAAGFPVTGIPLFQTTYFPYDEGDMPTPETFRRFYGM
jgi:hypothetical protein